MTMESLYQRGYSKSFSHTNAFSVTSQAPECDLQGTAKSLTCPSLVFGCLSFVIGKTFNPETVTVNHCRTAVVRAQCLALGTCMPVQQGFLSSAGDDSSPGHPFWPLFPQIPWFP